MGPYYHLQGYTQTTGFNNTKTVSGYVVMKEATDDIFRSSDAGILLGSI